MPIRPEQADRYPDNWSEIRAAILKRADHRCEGSPAYPDCHRINGEHLTLASNGPRVVLTIAHLDHDVTNNDPENLRAWCQRCHLLYDREHHAETRYLAGKTAARTPDLFDGKVDRLALRDGRT